MSSQEHQPEESESPSTPEDANALIGHLGEIESHLGKLSTDRDEAVRAARATFEARIDLAAIRRDRMIEQLVTYCTSRHDELTEGGKRRTIEFRNGVVKWRRTKPSLLIEEGDTEETVIKRVERLGGLKRFTRRGPRKLDKEALKKQPGFVARVKGLFIGQREDLIIKPHKLEKEIVKTGDPYRIPGKTVKKD